MKKTFLLYLVMLLGCCHFGMADVYVFTGSFQHILSPGNQSLQNIAMDSRKMGNLVVGDKRIENQVKNSLVLASEGTQYAIPLTVMVKTEDKNQYCFRVETYIPVMNITDDDFDIANPIRMNERVTTIFSKDFCYRKIVDMKTDEILVEKAYPYEGLSLTQVDLMFMGFLRLDSLMEKAERIESDEPNEQYKISEYSTLTVRENEYRIISWNGEIDEVMHFKNFGKDRLPISYKRISEKETLFMELTYDPNLSSSLDNKVFDIPQFSPVEYQNR